MRIFRIVLLGLAMALFAINFWAIDYQDLWGKNQPVGLPPYIGCFHYRYFRTTDGQTGYKE